MSTSRYDAAAEFAARELWHMPGRVELVHYSENRTYMVHEEPDVVPADARAAGVLRVCRQGYRTLEELESELMWVQGLAESSCGVKVATPIPSASGRLVEEVHLPNGATFNCAMFTFVAGHEPSISCPAANHELFREIGRIAAEMHSFVDSWSPPRKVVRPLWDCDTAMGPHATWGSWELFEGLADAQVEKLRVCESEVSSTLAELGTGSSRFGLIHSDMRFANLIENQQGLFVIDFDDCAFGWHGYDLACSLSFIEDDPAAPEMADAWLEGYREIREISKPEIDAVPSFVMMRRLQLTGWLASHGDSDPVPGFKENWVEGTMKVARSFMRYHSRTVMPNGISLSPSAPQTERFLTLPKKL